MSQSKSKTSSPLTSSKSIKATYSPYAPFGLPAPAPRLERYLPPASPDAQLARSRFLSKLPERPLSTLSRRGFESSGSYDGWNSPLQNPLASSLRLPMEKVKQKEIAPIMRENSELSLIIPDVKRRISWNSAITVRNTLSCSEHALFVTRCLYFQHGIG